MYIAFRHTCWRNASIVNFGLTSPCGWQEKLIIDNRVWDSPTIYNMEKNQMNKLQQEYYKKYEALINQIVQSGQMTFFNKSDLLEEIEKDLQEKIEQIKCIDFAC